VQVATKRLASQAIARRRSSRSRLADVPVFSGEGQRERGARPAASSATPCWAAVSVRSVALLDAVGLPKLLE